MALGGYSPYEVQVEELRRLADAAGGEVFEYGRSYEERPLLMVRVPPGGSSPARESVPGVMVTANIHGMELIGSCVARGVLRAVASPEGDAAALRERATLYVAPCLNPDGVARTFAAGGVGRVGELRKNARGVDLNRNFPLPMGVSPSRLPFTGSSRPEAATYRGPAPLSEPETAALAKLLDGLDVWASVSVHSFMGTFIPPRVLAPAHRATYRRLHRRFVSAQPWVRYRRLAGPLDRFTGELEDHQHHHRGTWAVCVETFSIVQSFRQHLRAPAVFWRFNPRDPEVWVRNDVPGVLRFLLAALDEPRPSTPVTIGTLLNRG